jgi:hypothetical protein
MHHSQGQVVVVMTAMRPKDDNRTTNKVNNELVDVSAPPSQPSFASLKPSR